MRKRKTRKRAAKKNAGLGVYRLFHGAFNSEARAKTKARSVGGFYVKRYINRRRAPSYVVITDPSVSPF